MTKSHLNQIMKLHIGSFFKDQKGQLVIWQWPNVPLYGWIIAKLFTLIVSDTGLKNSLSILSTTFLFLWAYLELSSGVNYFRRSIGFVVIAALKVHSPGVAVSHTASPGLSSGSSPIELTV